ncbi:MAG: peptide chain release factor N(5)-glutamine methyltransferase [Prevotella sp.]|nr:peptide chain release factor N(5)-glutamine methyltransferase [Prevotella sp.]
MNYEELWQPLTQVYDAGEARAVARMVLDVRFGMSLADVLCGKVTQLSAKEQAELQEIQQRLLQGEPVQYVLGVADFGPKTFLVTPDVLIPRPETYELCQWITDDLSPLTSPLSPFSVLDIGTGSGCIACTLAAQWPQAKVTGWDISAKALEVARRNAQRMGVDVSFEQRDMLNQPYNEFGLWDVVVSNPPYVCDSEADDMEPWVLDYEPETALFVPDDDPVMFYLQISNYAQSALKEGGRLYFEINPRFDEAIEDILLGLGFDDIRLKEDQFGKTRFMKATWH